VNGTVLARASGWGVLLAGIYLNEPIKLSQYLRKQLGIQRMLTGMCSADIMALCPKVLSQCGFQGRNDVAVFPMGLDGLLFRKYGAYCNEVISTALWV